jgi:hypothetical protein
MPFDEQNLKEKGESDGGGTGIRGKTEPFARQCLWNLT